MSDGITYCFYFAANLEPHDYMYFPDLPPAVRNAVVAEVLKHPDVVALEIGPKELRIRLAGAEVERIESIPEGQARWSSMRHLHAVWRDRLILAAEKFVVACAPGDVRDAVGWFEAWETNNQNHLNLLGEQRLRLERALWQIARGTTHDNERLTMERAQALAKEALAAIGVTL